MSSHPFHQMQETSLMAYDKHKKKLGKRESIILKAIYELTNVIGDCTDSEAMNHLMKEDPNYVRPRRYDLVNKYKFVGFSQKRTCKITGETCMAWKILQGGINEIRKMPGQMQEEETFDQTP